MHSLGQPLHQQMAPMPPHSQQIRAAQQAAQQMMPQGPHQSQMIPQGPQVHTPSSMAVVVPPDHKGPTLQVNIQQPNERPNTIISVYQCAPDNQPPGAAAHGRGAVVGQLGQGAQPPQAARPQSQDNEQHNVIPPEPVPPASSNQITSRSMAPIGSAGMFSQRPQHSYLSQQLHSSLQGQQQQQQQQFPHSIGNVGGYSVQPHSMSSSIMSSQISSSLAQQPQMLGMSQQTPSMGMSQQSRFGLNQHAATVVPPQQSIGLTPQLAMPQQSSNLPQPQTSMTQAPSMVSKPSTQLPEPPSSMPRPLTAKSEESEEKFPQPTSDLSQVEKELPEPKVSLKQPEVSSMPQVGLSSMSQAGSGPGLLQPASPMTQKSSEMSKPPQAPPMTHPSFEMGKQHLGIGLMPTQTLGIARPIAPTGSLLQQALMPQQSMGMPSQPMGLSQQPLGLPQQSMDMSQQPIGLSQPPMSLSQQPMSLAQNPMGMPQPAMLDQEGLKPNELLMSPIAQSGDSEMEASPVKGKKTKTPKPKKEKVPKEQKVSKPRKPRKGSAAEAKLAAEVAAATVAPDVSAPPGSMFEPISPAAPPPKSSGDEIGKDTFNFETFPMQSLDQIPKEAKPLPPPSVLGSSELVKEAEPFKPKDSDEIELKQLDAAVAQVEKRDAASKPEVDKPKKSDEAKSMESRAVTPPPVPKKRAYNKKNKSPATTTDNDTPTPAETPVAPTQTPPSAAKDSKSKKPRY